METIWFMWAVAYVLVITGKNEAATTLSGLPWCHGILGGIAAVAFYGVHLGLLK
jgi:hypothetical protein